MVEITKGSGSMEVTYSAYENFYKSAGWVLSIKDVSSVTGTEGFESEEDWDEVLKEENEKPLSQMNNTELIEKAISLGLKVNGNVSNKQLREMIKRATS